MRHDTINALVADAMLAYEMDGKPLAREHGAPVRVVKSAPLGDPIQVCIRNYHLALRRVEAQSIEVTLGE